MQCSISRVATRLVFVFRFINIYGVLQVRVEIDAQLAWFFRHVGCKPTHVDGHQHIHVLPGVCDVFAQLLQKHDVGWTRVPSEMHISECSWVDERRRAFYERVVADAKKASLVFSQFGLSYPDCFVGLSTAGADQTIERLVSGIRREVGAFRKGSSPTSGEDVVCELMVHPGDVTPREEGGCGSGPDNFAMSADREHETNLLSSCRLRDELSKDNFLLRSWSELPH